MISRSLTSEERKTLKKINKILKEGEEYLEELLKFQDQLFPFPSKESFPREMIQYNLLFRKTSEHKYIDEFPDRLDILTKKSCMLFSQEEEIDLFLEMAGDIIYSDVLQIFWLLKTLLTLTSGDTETLAKVIEGKDIV